MTRDRDATCLQIGGAGDIAGGLSQVIAAIELGRFENFSVGVLPTRSSGSPLRTVLRTSKVLLHLASQFRNRRRTVIAAHLSQGGSFLREGAIVLVASALGYPVVAHLHGSAFAAYAAKNRRRCSFVLTRACAIVVLSDETETAVTQLLPGAAVHKLANGVVVPELTETKSKTIVFGGTVGLRKGVDTLLDAWTRIDPRDWTLRVFGPVEMSIDAWTDLPQAAIEGPLDHDSLLGVLDRSMVAVLPSRAEALPMFLLEAMARENAVISTTVGGIPQLIGSDRGLLVEPGDVDALATALQKLIDNVDLVAQMGAAGRRVVEEKYSAELVFRQLEDVWSKALSSKTRELV